MKSSTTTHGLIAAGVLLLCCGVRGWGQDQSSSLGDIARKSRKEHASGSHITAKQVVNEEEDGPDPGGVWRLNSCAYLPCMEVAITLPKTLKWTRPANQPRPVLISLTPDEPSHAIRIYAGDALWGATDATRYYPDTARRNFLQELFARPEYFGQAARLVRDEHVQQGSYAATITHFTVATGDAKYRGLSIVSAAISGALGFACVYREEDSKEAASICDGIISRRGLRLKPNTSRRCEPSIRKNFHLTVRGLMIRERTHSGRSAAARSLSRNLKVKTRLDITRAVEKLRSA